MEFQGVGYARHILIDNCLQIPVPMPHRSTFSPLGESPRRSLTGNLQAWLLAGQRSVHPGHAGNHLHEADWTVPLVLLYPVP
ncbi:hypothetical protein KC319_g17 [Hortaea werneckii]|nr:hypothetical protein KC319_g17 [Hortaea werneckii]